MDRRRTDSHDGKLLDHSSSGLPSSEIVEEALHIHRLFIRSQFAKTNPHDEDLDGMIDYPSEIHSVIFLEKCFVFLYDNRLHRSGYYDNYHYPMLIMEDRIVSICLLNEKMSQILVLFESTGELMILVFHDISWSFQTSSHSQSKPHQQMFQLETLSYGVKVDFLSYMRKYDMLMNGNAFNGNQYASPLQENYSVDIRYFSQFGLIVVACHPALEVEEYSITLESKLSTNYTSLQSESKVLEITINDTSNDGVVDQQHGQETNSLFAAKELLSISTKFLHNDSIFSIWDGFDIISSKRRIFLATSYQDNVIYLWQVRLSAKQRNSLDGEAVDMENNSDEDDDPNEIFEEDEREAELAMEAMLAAMPKTLVGDENEEDDENDDDEDDEEFDEEYDDENDEEHEQEGGDEKNEKNEPQQYVDTDTNERNGKDNSIDTDLSGQDGGGVSSETEEDKHLNDNQGNLSLNPTTETSQMDGQSTILQDNRKLMKIKTKHKAWITALSQVIPPADVKVEGTNRYFVASGDKLGSIALYDFSSDLLHPNSEKVDHGDQCGDTKKKAKRSRYDSRKGPWKICDFRHNVTGQHAITVLLLQFCYRDHTHVGTKLFAGDQSGKVTVLEISHKTSKMHILQTLSLFSTFGAITTLSISPTNQDSSFDGNMGNNHGDETVDTSGINNSTARLRCYSNDSGEAIECCLSPSMASVFKIWPESILQEKLGKAKSVHASRYDSTIYKAQNLIDSCFILVERNILIVSDFTKQMHLYDIKTGNLLISMTMPIDKCTCLLALPFVYSVRKPFELGQSGKTHSLEQWMNFANQQLQGLQYESGITVISGHKTGEVVIYHLFFPTHGDMKVAKQHVGTSQEFESLMAGSSKTSQFHLEHPTFYSSEPSQPSGYLEGKSRRQHSPHQQHSQEEDWMSSSQVSNDDEVFDLLDSPIMHNSNGNKQRPFSQDDESNQSNRSGSSPDVHKNYEDSSEVLHLKHHHHYLAQNKSLFVNEREREREIFEGAGEDGHDDNRHPYYEVVQTLRPSPLHVTDLFFSTTGQYLVSIHLKRFLFIFSNELHFKTLHPIIEDKRKQHALKNPTESVVSPTDQQTLTSNNGKTKTTNKVGRVSNNSDRHPQTNEPEKQSALNKITKKSPIVGPNVCKSKNLNKPMIEDDPNAIVFPKETYRFVHHFELDRNVYSITELIPTLLEEEPIAMENKKKESKKPERMSTNIAGEMEKEMGLEKERLVLVISGPDSTVIGLFDAISGSYLIKIPLPAIPLNMVNPATSTVTISSVQSRVRCGLIWDFPIKGSKERSLLGLCPTSNPDQYLIFNETHGFQLLNDQDHMNLVKQQALQQQQSSFSSSYHSSWQRDQIIGLQGFSAFSSPIVTAWSNYHSLLLRIQLHQDRGVLMMRSKHYFTHNLPQSGDQLNHYNNRIISVKSLKKSSHIRNHRVLVVLSNGYGIVLHL
jgi:hypothetical protein